jgi:hypothetical protein
MLQLFGIVGGLLAFLGYFPYVLDILKHKVKPQRATFFIWSVLGLIAVFSQLAKGAGYSLWLPSLETLGSLVVFLLSIPYGMGGFGKRDYITLCIAALGLVAWYFTKEAAVALYLVILVDAAGLYLELHKTYLHPETETHTAWILAAMGGVFTALAVGSWSFILLSYPIYIILANTAVVVAIQMGLQRKRR